MAAALVGRAIQAKAQDNAQQVMGKILAYAKKFKQKEMGVMLVSDMHRAIGEDIFAVPEFSDWANDIAELMIY